MESFIKDIAGFIYVCSTASLNPLTWVAFHQGQRQLDENNLLGSLIKDFIVGADAVECIMKMKEEYVKETEEGGIFQQDSFRL